MLITSCGLARNCRGLSTLCGSWVVLVFMTMVLFLESTGSPALHAGSEVDVQPYSDENEIATHPHRHKHGEKDSPTDEPRTILPFEGSGTIPFEIRFPPPPRILPPPPPIFRHKTESWIRDSMYNKMMAQLDVFGYFNYTALPGCPNATPVGPDVTVPPPRTMALREIEVLRDNTTRSESTEEQPSGSTVDNGNQLPADSVGDPVRDVELTHISTPGSSYIEQVTVDGLEEENMIITGIPGEPGPPGPQGIVGPKGRRGRKGKKGPEGPPGQTGPRGPIGSQGVRGRPGHPGLPGIDGAKGERGLIGTPGHDGNNGGRGSVGLPGLPGRRGRDGIPGLIIFRDEPAMVGVALEGLIAYRSDVQQLYFRDSTSWREIKVSRCGDGVIDWDLGEKCDDGNDDVRDHCVGCRRAFCGDGFRHEGYEECDDRDFGGESCSKWKAGMTGILECTRICTISYNRCRFKGR